MMSFSNQISLVHFIEDQLLHDQDDACEYHSRITMAGLLHSTMVMAHFQLNS